ncbi:1,4-alpha-glucan branching protein [Streptomyces sp. NBC_01288]|uniref:maltokinase N-terminal cap-like domain-containing protein n=1 Tax=Streptomyces sp. NBC_01288 TaxID=2903814 RepID=UPI002E12FF75|nr:1,4-alpha-glucan branching protein [Streptomyces sp. NBC_01288]
MAVIHQTYVKPTKLELLTPWLPTRAWYHGPAEPELVKSGGFRLDDPEGEVGIEFMVVTDGPGAYLVPLTYRAAPLPGAEHALVGTMEHGVLGPRWVYDGCHDPVLTAGLTAFVEGRVEAQAQSVSHTLDREVARSWTGTAPVPALGAPTDTAETTEFAVPDGPTLRLHRVLTPGSTPPEDTIGQITGAWTQADGTRVRALFATLQPG